jgi:hypothetical protein
MICSPEFGILAGMAPLTLEFMQKAPLKPRMGTIWVLCCYAIISPEVRTVHAFIRNPPEGTVVCGGQNLVGAEK